MTETIKITALTDIAANIAYTTLVPVVNMSGSPLSQKANLQIVGNLILQGAGGSYFAAAAQAVIAQSVANAAQPNITSVGTLTSLTVSGNVTSANANLGNLITANFASINNDLTASGNVVAFTISTTPILAGNLPSAAAVGAGARAFVTDADSTTFNDPVVGGGSNNMPVFSNGTSWFIG